MKPGGGGLLLGAATVVVVAAVVAGFFALGSPGDERVRQLDQRRLDDLREIANAVQLAVDDSAHGLPDSLTSPIVLRYVQRGVKDPLTGVPYGYRVTGPRTFELCATFQASLEDGDSYGMDRNWNHPVGPACFQFDVDADRRKYPLIPVRPSAAPASRPTPPSGVR